MNKHIAIGAVSAVVLCAVLLFGAFGSDWFQGQSDNVAYDDEGNPVPQPVPFDPDTSSGAVSTDSLNYVVFEKYGPLLVVLAVLMFGAIVGGVCIAREETEKDDDSEVSE